jgi:hypothetical protein
LAIVPTSSLTILSEIARGKTPLARSSSLFCKFSHAVSRPSFALPVGSLGRD